MSVASIRKYSSGMTLIELVTAMIVLALLLALALPSFTSAITRNRLTSQANEMAAAFALARTEALRRNRLVTVCGSADSATCAADWSGGWLVWADENQNGVFDAGADPVLQTGLVSEKDTFVAVDGVSAVGFNFRGRRITPAGALFSMSGHPDDFDCAEDGVEYLRVVTVTASGIISSRKPQVCP